MAVLIRVLFIFCLFLILPGTARAACTAPAGDAGDILYNAEVRLLQYCDGTDWQAVWNTHGIPAAGLVAHWTLGDGSGTTAIDSAGSYDGTLTNAPVWSAGKLGGALQFNNNSDYVDMGDIAEIRGVPQLTMSAWMKRNAANAKVLLGKQAGGGSNTIALELWTDGKLNCGLSDNAAYAAGDVTLNDTAWHHIAMVFNGTQTGNAGRLKCYVDGVAQSLSFSGTIPAVTAADTGYNFRAGRIQSSYSSGLIDDVRLYSRALSEAEVQALYDLGAGNLSDACNPANSPAAGQVCADGSVYAGNHPVNGEPLYVPPADNSSAVTWNNGTGNWTTTGTTSATDGQANTATLDGLSDAGSPHQAAKLCANLSAHGHTDWYLLAKDELNILYTNRVAIGGFDTSGSYPSGYYWSSSEVDNGNAWTQRFSDGLQDNSYDKDGVKSVRCARQGYVSHCDNPAGAAGDIRYNGDFNVLQWCGGGKWHAAGPVPGAGGAGCGNPAGAAADLIYNGDYKVLQYCDGSVWRAIGKVQPPADPCAGTPSPGDVCADGTVYAGDLSGTKLFVPPADNSSGVTWNNGTSNWTVTGATSLTDGAANTATLDGLADAGSPHQAAKLCANLSANGHTDWYLPAKDELDVIYDNLVDQNGDNTPGGPLGDPAVLFGFDTSGSWPSGYYWSSSEESQGYAWPQKFSDGIQSRILKKDGLSVRCARKN